MTSSMPTDRSESDSVVTNNKVSLTVKMGVSRANSRPDSPKVNVEFRPKPNPHPTRVKSYHMGWAQVVEELSWKLSTVSFYCSTC